MINKRLTIPENVISDVLKQLGLHTYRRDLLFGPSRAYDIAEKRIKVLLELRRRGYGHSSIAKVINRDHSTVFYLEKKYG